MDRRPLPAACLLTALLAALLLVAAPAFATTPFPISESFRNTTMDPNWVPTGSAGLTAATDGNGNGWMRLTGAVNNQFGSVRNELAFPSNNGILAEFEYATWGGTGADGLTFFLYDGTTASGSFHTGPAGGSIGYTDCNSTPGLSGAYIGVAFDEWGNFALGSFCNQGGLANNPARSDFLWPNRVTIRGSEANSYPYLTSAATTESLLAQRSQARKVKVSVTPDMKMSVYLTYPDGTIQTVASDYQLPAAPSTLKLGWVAATGGSNNNHEIRNSQVVMPVDLATSVTDGAAGAGRATQRTWTADVTNNGPNDTSNATVKATAGTPGLSNVAWTCAGTAGGVCQAASGTGVPDTKADLPVGGKVTYTITADAAAATDYASMKVVADTGAGEPTGEMDPTNNTATDTTDLTPVDDVAPTASLSSGGTASLTSVGTWRGGNLGFTRNWQHCDADGTSCADIAGATATTYATQAADAGHTLRLRVRATNAADTTDAYTSVFALPDTSIVTGPATRTASTAATFDLATTGAAGTTFACSLDGAAYAACADPATFSGLADGTHTLGVRAVYGGLTDPTPATQSWTVDTQTAVALTAPTAGTIAARRPTVAGTAEAGAALTVVVDGTTVATGVAAGDGTFAIALPADLADGAHTIAVTGADDLGNTATDTVAVTVDATAPDAPRIVTGPSAVTSSTDATFTVAAEAGAHLRCRLDDGPWQDCPQPIAYTGLKDGPHTFSVVAIDATGNQSPRADRTWTVDTTPPAAPPVLTGPELKTATGLAHFKVSLDPGSTLECSLDGATFSACDADIALEGLPAGHHTLIVRQVDAAGNVGAPGRYDWDVAASAPAAPAKVVAAKRLAARIAARATAGDNRHLTVGCVLDHVSMTWCRVKAYTTTAGGRRALVGTGARTLRAAGHRTAIVRVTLNAAGRRLVGRAVGGMRVQLAATAQSRGSARTLKAGVHTVLYPQQLTVLPTINPFVFDSTRMISRAAWRALHTVAADVRHAKVVTCVGHTDAVGSAAYNYALGLRRAQAVCAALRHLGVRARVRAASDGETQPRASNATAGGRLANRRVELRIAY